MQDDLIPFIPFEKLRGRTLIWCYLITGFVYGMIRFGLQRVWSESGQNLLPDAVADLLFYAIFLVCISPILFRSRLSYKQLFGSCPAWATFRWYILWTFPLIIFSVVAIYLQYVLSHYLVPEIADWWFNARSTSLDSENLIVNVLNFTTIVLIVPIFEEFFVRGILLTRWSIKWGTPKAIFMSSLFFGILHTDIIGAFFFGYVMSILYIRTKSLIIPISIHMANNFIVLAGDIVERPMREVPQHETHIVLQESEALWLMALAVIIIPWAINIVWKNFPKESWRVPYFAEARYLK
ncbi:MAG: type II CAAX endopeptidase family protein [Candidatus Poribacteria bacterium]|nr:type II CAAX endopeptidase family protein [Candidatus Poribacteria bacterium]